jgi:hypothetical protein
MHLSCPVSARWPWLAVPVVSLVVATDRALYHQGGRSWGRLGWEQVGEVRWDNQRDLPTPAGRCCGRQAEPGGRAGEQDVVLSGFPQQDTEPSAALSSR